MLVITEKPMRTISVCGWYVSDYEDNSGKKVYKLVGIVKPKSRGRIVTRDSKVIKDIYNDEETIVIYRHENLNNVKSCKHMMDLMASRGAEAFSIYTFYQWLNNNQGEVKEDAH